MRSLPRRPAALVALGLGLLALVWGLAGLQRIFDRELEEARAALELEERALVDFAERELGLLLREEMQLGRERIREASIDPLLSDAGLYLRRGEGIVLPRSARPRDGEGAPARDLHARLVDPGAPLPEDEADEVWATRLDLLRAFQQAIRDGGRVEALFRSLLTHRARYRISTERDLPYQLALLDFFVAEGLPDRGLLQSLLREGVTASDGTHLPGLQRRLLQRIDRFSRGDIEFFTGRIIALSEASGVPHDDFLDRLKDLGLCLSPTCVREDEAGVIEPERLAPPVLITTEEPVLATSGWLLWARSDGIEGVGVDPEAFVENVATMMSGQSILGEGDRFSLRLADEVTAIGEVDIGLESPRIQAAKKEIRRRHRLKSALGGLLAVSTIGIVALVGLLVVRERRHLELRSDLVAAVSHELRTPLASVRLLAETLDRRLGSLPEARDYPSRIVREADRLGMLVENILSFNRLESGSPILRRSEVDPVEIAESLREDLAPYLRGELSLDLTRLESAGLTADPELFRLLLQNLFSNAARYCERDPVRIVVSSERSERELVLRVRDNGIGIPGEDHERIFTEFYRRTPSGERSSGYGLGLAICRRIMALHGGGIRVESSGPDGTCFELRFSEEK